MYSSCSCFNSLLVVSTVDNHSWRVIEFLKRWYRVLHYLVTGDFLDNRCWCDKCAGVYFLAVDIYAWQYEIVEWYDFDMPYAVFPYLMSLLLNNFSSLQNWCMILVLALLYFILVCTSMRGRSQWETMTVAVMFVYSKLSTFYTQSHAYCSGERVILLLKACLCK